MQPVIENAIKHGFEGFISGGILKISFCDLSDSQLKIVIEDNGQGMEAGTIRAIESAQYQSDSEQGVGPFKCAVPAENLLQRNGSI